ncbi:helix-turn-helix domain-containing protein [Pendulispora rubella]|uniref:winged helix-turn-helix domain-containing protein n=1 Tax=Pendulispora rubella TaxID=2741070 RepID=UPI00374E170E
MPRTEGARAIGPRSARREAPPDRRGGGAWSADGRQWDGLPRSIDLRVSCLRGKVGDDPDRPTLIFSVRGVGYMLALNYQEDDPQADSAG